MTLSPVFYLGLSFTLIILVTISVALFLSWRKRTALHASLAEVLDDINQQQIKRQTILARKLRRKLDMSDTDTTDLCNQLIDAEKMFLQHYVTQVLQQAPSAELYVALCELLDVYTSRLISATPEPENDRSELDATENQLYGQASTEPAQGLPEPDWGDVFD